MNKTKNAIVAILAAATLTACADTSGAGNEFTITGTIKTVGERSITVVNIDIIDAHGEAADWWDAGEYQVHDNYRTCSWDGLEFHTVGHGYIAGMEVELDQFHPGDTVRIEGSIRDSFKSCGKNRRYGSRPVFTTAAVDS